MTHAQKRLKQRYGFQPTKKMINTILRWIRHGSPKAQFVRESGGGTAMYRIQVKRKRVVAIYHQRRDFIVTFLPEGAA